jgi:gliding motility-associated-like protein
LKNLLSFVFIFFLTFPFRVVASPIDRGSLVVDFSAPSVCFGNVTTLISHSTVSGDSIRFQLWDLNGDGKFGDATGDIVNHVFTSGSHDVGLKVITWGGEAMAIYKLVAVGEIRVDFNYENGCVDQDLHFSDKSEVTGDIIIARIWDFGDGSAPSIDQNPTHAFTAAGNFEVKLLAYTQSGCVDSIVHTVTIGDIVTIDLRFSGDTIFIIGDSVIAYVQGAYDSIRWSTGSNASSIIIKTKGSYYVKAYVGGCSAMKYFNIQVNKYGSAPMIMTLFTPNGDGMNDRWEILNLLSVGPCDATVYSRSGEKVFSNSVYANEWDGTFKGKALANDTYYYFVRCFDDILLQGTINILK